jgi:hypothetical protein
VLEAEVWAKCVVSPAWMENVRQLMMAPGLLVTVRTLPTWFDVTVPLVTEAICPFDSTGALMKHAATAATPSRTDAGNREACACLRGGIL